MIDIKTMIEDVQSDDGEIQLQIKIRAERDINEDGTEEVANRDFTLTIRGNPGFDNWDQLSTMLDIHLERQREKADSAHVDEQIKTLSEEGRL